MRDLAKLELHRRKPLAPPSDALIKAFEAQYNVHLPQAYIQVLKHCNGGRSQHDSFEYDLGDGEIGESSMRHFYSLTEDRDEQYGVWSNTEFVRELTNLPVVAFAENSGGDFLYLLFDGDACPVYMLFRDGEEVSQRIASSFADFIDKLFILDDLI